MGFSITTAISALFSKPRNTMALQSGWELVFDSTAKHSTNAFLCFFYTEAFQAKFDPNLEVLERLIVDKIIHKKIPEPPEHEFLLIHTHDTLESNKLRRFILERTVYSDRTKIQETPDVPDLNIETHHKTLSANLFDIIKRFMENIATILSSESDSALASSQLSMEEGTSHTFSHSSSVAHDSLSITDSVTVSVSESADAVSVAVAESLDQDKIPALDRFLGDHYVGLPRWTGTELRGFRPKNLMMFQLVLLANVVHQKYPKYTQLGPSCLFYASLVYKAAEMFGGNAGAVGGHAPQLIGHWQGVKVTKVDSQMVSRVVGNFKRALSHQIAEVNVCSFNSLSY